MLLCKSVVPPITVAPFELNWIFPDAPPTSGERRTEAAEPGAKTDDVDCVSRLRLVVGFALVFVLELSLVIVTPPEVSVLPPRACRRASAAVEPVVEVVSILLEVGATYCAHGSLDGVVTV